MKDQEMKRQIQKALDARLSGLRPDPLLARRVIAANENKKSMEGEKKVMKKKIPVGFILAAALVLMSAMALAARELNVFRLSSLPPLEGAEELVETDVGQTQDDLIGMAVEEVLFDGQGVRLVFRLAPKDPETYALLNSAYQNTPSSLYTIEEGAPIPVPPDAVLEYPVPDMVGENGEPLVVRIPTYEENGVLYYEHRPIEYRRKDGKTVVEYGIDIACDEEALEMDSWWGEDQADGSVLVLVEGRVLESADAIPLAVSCVYRLGEDRHEIAPLPFTLTANREIRRAALVPEGDGRGERFQVLSGELALSPAQGYLTLLYAYEESEDEPMGIDWRVYDASDRLLDSAYGAWNEIVGPDGKTTYLLRSDIQAVAEWPETLTLEAKVIGEDRTLGRCVCRVEPAGE